MALGTIALLFAGTQLHQTAQAADLPNLLPNSTFAQPDSTDATLPSAWRRGFWGTNQAEFLYPVAGTNDAYAVQVQMHSISSGDAKWYTDPRPVTPGREYRFEDVYKANVTTALVAELRTASGSPRYSYLASVPIASSWTPVAVTFSIPDDIQSVSIFHLLDQVGSLTIDNPSLTLVEAAPPPNATLPPNGSFESGSNLPTSWSKGQWGTLQAAFVYPDIGVNNSRAATVTINSYQNGDAKWVFSPFIPTSTQPLEYEDTYRATVSTKLVAEYTLANATRQYQELANLPAATNWQTARATFTPPNNTQQVVVFHLIDQIGSLTIDDVRLSSQSAPPPPNPTNLIPNADLQERSGTLPAHWTRDQWGAIQANFTYPVAGPNSSTALQVSVTSRTSGDAKWSFESVPVTPGLIYRYSAVYTANAPSILGAEYEMNNGTFVYDDLQILPAAANFTSVEARFSPPSGALRMNVSQRLEQLGTLTTAQMRLPPPIPTDTAAFDEGLITLSFDDGFLNNYEVAAPLLRSAGIHATFYVMPDYLLSGYPDFMQTTQALLLRQDGHEIGSHSNTHPFLSQLTATSVQQEVAGSRQTLQQLGLGPIDTFAYPFGDYSDTVVQAVQAAGYLGARSVQPGFNTRLSDPFLLKDQHVESDTTIDQVQSWITQAKNDRTWLILELHQQSTNGGQYSNSPAMLQAILQRIQAAGLRSVTMREGLTLLRN